MSQDRNHRHQRYPGRGMSTDPQRRVCEFLVLKLRGVMTLFFPTAVGFSLCVMSYDT